MNVDLGAMIGKLRTAEGASLIDLMEIAGLNPKTDFAGGDWRWMDFSRLDMRGMDFRNARLFQAHFLQAQVEDADFRGASGIVPPKPSQPGLLEAKDWRLARLDQIDRDNLFFLDALKRGLNDEEIFADLKSNRPLNADDFHNLIKAASEYYIAKRVYETMLAAGFPPTKYALTMLLDKADTEAQINAALEEMRLNEIEPDLVTFNALMDKASSLDEARTVFDRIEAANLEPDDFTAGIMAKKASTLEDGLRILRTMHDRGVHLNPVCFAPLIEKADSHQEALRVIRDMKAIGIAPRMVHYNAVLKKASTKAEIRNHLGLLAADKLHPGTETFNILLSKRKNLKEAVSLAQEFPARGLRPNRLTLIGLLSHASSFDETVDALIHARRIGVDVKSETALANLIMASPDRNWSRMRALGMEMNGESVAARMRRLVVHWTSEERRSERLVALFFTPPPADPNP